MITNKFKCIKLFSGNSQSFPVADTNKDEARVTLNVLSKCVSEVPRKEVKVLKKTMSGRKLEDLTYNSIKYLESIGKLSCQNDVENVLAQLDSLLELLPGPLTVQKLIYMDDVSYASYAENSYTLFIEILINLFDNNFPFRGDQLYEPVKNLFSIEDPDIFKVNVESLLKQLKGKLNVDPNVFVHLLEISLKSEGYFACLFNHICAFDFNDFLVEERSRMWNDFLKILVSLPNRVGNFLEGKLPNFFIPKNFSKFLTFNLLKLIEFVSEVLKFEPEYESSISFQNISLLVSKVFINFNDKLRSKELITFIESTAILTNKSTGKINLYKRIFVNILMHFDRPTVEIVAKMFLLNIDPKKYLITEIWGKNLLKNDDWKFILCTKIPLRIYYEKEYSNLIINLVVYLSCSSQFHLMQLFTNLLSVWADRSSITHTSVEQHIYISKIIIYIVNSLQNIGLSDSERSKIQKILFSGIPLHLESAVELIRTSGMKTGEIIINFLDRESITEEHNELNFDYDNLNEESKKIVTELQNIFDSDMQEYYKIKQKFDTTIDELTSKLLTKDQEFQYIPPERQFRKRQASEEPSNEIVLSKAIKPKNDAIKIIDSTDFELDSDDDLEPYDLSNDVKISSRKPPAYLRDLRDGLLETENHEIFTLSLENCESLIVSQLPDDDATIGLEILEILISLEQRFYVENFDSLVFQSCVAITCIYPAYYAEYLCKQVHADLGTHSIARRIFVLDVLRRSAEALSNLKPDTKNEGDVTKRAKEISGAEEVIRKRLESKTRYFHKHKYFKLEKVNKYAEVAGHFSFPLLYGFNQNKMLCQSTKEDCDCLLLIHFIETLAILMWCSRNCPIAPRMASEIFRFSWYLRFHRDVKVRIVILSLISSVVVNVPKSILLKDFINELLEIRLWLGDVLNPVRGEPNSDCRNLAACAMILVEGILKVDVDVNET